jgi:hypothetical protein
MTEGASARTPDNQDANLWKALESGTNQSLGDREYYLVSDYFAQVLL